MESWYYSNTDEIDCLVISNWPQMDDVAKGLREVTDTLENALDHIHCVNNQDLDSPICYIKSLHYCSNGVIDIEFFDPENIDLLMNLIKPGYRFQHTDGASFIPILTRGRPYPNHCNCVLYVPTINSITEQVPDVHQDLVPVTGVLEELKPVTTVMEDQEQKWMDELNLVAEEEEEIKKQRDEEEKMKKQQEERERHAKLWSEAIEFVKLQVEEERRKKEEEERDRNKKLWNDAVEFVKAQENKSSTDKAITEKKNIVRFQCADIRYIGKQAPGYCVIP